MQKPLWHSHSLRVRYQETDQMGVVYHANYLNWFEIGRTEWVRDKGLTYQELESKGIYLPVVDLGASYHQPAYYDDVITIYTRIKEFTPIRISFEVNVKREDTLLASGWTKHVWVGSDFKPIRLNKKAPEWYEILSQ